MSKDVIVLVADVQQEKTLEILLSVRCESLGIRAITFDIFRHPHKDSGVFHGAADFLASYQPPAYTYALVLLDHAWTGAPPTATELQQALKHRLVTRGWDDKNCQVIVAAPELEAWVWSTSPRVAEVLRTSWDDIHVLARQHNYWREGDVKPHQPKELLEAILKQQQRPRSSAIYQELARRVSLAGCQDAAFQLLCTTLREWFAG